MKKYKLPPPGGRFTYRAPLDPNSTEFIYLGREQGGILAVAAALLDDMPFDEGDKNDWRSSSLREYLNSEFRARLDYGDVMPFISDLTADDGLKDYGNTKDYVFLLSCDLYRKYREFIPCYNRCWWTLTPYTTPSSPTPWSASLARFVNTDGTVYYGNAYNSIAVAPACLFNPKIFE